MAKLLTAIEATEIPTGSVLWIEYWFDGITACEAFLDDFDISQRDVLVNSRKEYIVAGAEDLKNDIRESFANHWKIKKFRFWDDYPSKEESDAEKEWYE